MKGYTESETELLMTMHRRSRFIGSRSQLEGLVARGILKWAPATTPATVGVYITLRGELAILCVLALRQRCTT